MAEETPVIPLPTAPAVNAAVDAGGDLNIVDKIVSAGEAEAEKEVAKAVPVVEKSLDERVADIEKWIKGLEANHWFRKIIDAAEQWGKSLF